MHTLNYRAASGEYRAGSDINIQNKFADTILLSSWMPGISQINIQNRAEYIFLYRDGCCEYHTGSEINIQNIADYIFVSYRDGCCEYLTIALSLRSIFKIKLLSPSLYRAGCCKYRTWSEINIQNIAYYKFWISSCWMWMSWISRWLWHQLSKYSDRPYLNIEMDSANIALAPSTKVNIKLNTSTLSTFKISCNTLSSTSSEVLRISHWVWENIQNIVYYTFWIPQF